MRPLRSLALPISLSLSLLACRDAPIAPPTPSTPRLTQTLALTEGGALVSVVGDSATDRAIREAQDAVRNAPGRARPLLRLAQLFVRKARESSDPGFYQQADDAVSRALRIDPDDLAAQQIRGLVLMQDHRFAEARDLARRAIARDPEQAVFYGLLGDAEMEVGHYDRAEEAYQRMIDLRPNLASYSRGSWMRWLLGDVEGAIELGRHAVEAGSPRVPEEMAWTIVQLGNLYLASGNLDEAMANFEAALRVFPSYPTALDARSQVKRLRGDLAGAIADARAAVDGATTTEHLVHLGEAQEAAGNTADAASTYAQAERAGRRSDPRTLALFYANHDRDREAAVALARREVSARGDDVYADDVLAWTLYRAGQLDEAARLCDRARRLGTREARFSYHAGMIALALGHRDEAATLLRDALRMNSRFDAKGADDARRTLAMLDGSSAREVRVADR